MSASWAVRVRRFGSTGLAVGFWCGTGAAAAQEPSVPLAGVVRDATSGAPVPNATVVSDGGGGGAVSDSLGLFRFASVSPGARLLRVRALGYEELVVPVTALDGMAPLEISLEPRPIEVEGIEVTGHATRGALAGVVLDAVTGEGIPWASLWLRDAERSSTDERGAFSFPGVAPGSYLLLAERLGYVGLYVPVRAPEGPLVVRLEPDPVLLEGIRVVNRRLENRRRGYALGSVRAYDEARLRGSAAPDVQSFLEQEASLAFDGCGRAGGLCVAGRGGPVEPMVFVDDRYVPCGLGLLRSYSPSELYALDVFDRGKQIRAYTTAFMERQGRRPGALFPADIVPRPVPC